MNVYKIYYKITIAEKFPESHNFDLVKSHSISYIVENDYIT